MSITINQILITRCCLVFASLVLSITLTACGSSPKTDDATGDTGAPVTEASAPAGDSAAPAAESAAADSTDAAAEPAAETKADVAAAEAAPPRVVDSCKDEAYIKYEQQARESMKKGLAATKADQFGVGFRSVEEHNLWTKVHGDLFKKVSASCEKLANCAKEHKKDKDTECVNEAKEFKEWQGLAKSFAAKAKQAETTQPPKICSLDPALSDPARCFHGLADNISKTCETEECGDLAQCWNSVGYLDKAIIQAEQACGFVHQKLEACRGYTEATSRREAKFKQCQETQAGMKLEIFPVL